MRTEQAWITIKEGNLYIRGSTVLTQVPENIILTPAAADSLKKEGGGVFISTVLEESKSRHVVPLGRLPKTPFLACFRFKLWWMSHMTGQQAEEIPKETQFLLLQTQPNSYTALFPLIDSSFRSSLHGSPSGLLHLCIESGDSSKKASHFQNILFLSFGEADPFDTISAAVSSIQTSLKTFKRREEKRLPEIVDYFGWCTWDAFYQRVDQEGVLAGASSLAQGGAPPGFIIIDDGWQCTSGDGRNKEEGELERLNGVRENDKFDMERVVGEVKKKVGVKYVYVWHALAGYWGGVKVGGGGGSNLMDKYWPVLRYGEVGEGVRENEGGWEEERMVRDGVGLVGKEEARGFYDDMHCYLEGVGVDGVKVDVQCILETLGEGLGGRVEVTRAFHDALDSSVAAHFRGNRIIACMSHGSDALYCSKQTAVARASDDFLPNDPISHSIHVAAAAYNSVFLGEFMLPDWDMFHSVHPAAEFHASARAISGGPIYISDVPGKHDFDLLRKLVLPDGSVLRARLPGRPTKDCLFSDPCRDGVSLLKIWNMNKHSGVVGVYNCQGAAWNKKEKKNTFTANRPGGMIYGEVSPGDVPHLNTIPVVQEWDGECAVYSHRGRELTLVGFEESVRVGLEPLDYELFTLSPVGLVGSGPTRFAPLGLVHMFNGGAAVDGVEAIGGEVVGVRVFVKGGGTFAAYSSVTPKQCFAQNELTLLPFVYHQTSGLVTVELVAHISGGLHVVLFLW